MTLINFIERWNGTLFNETVALNPGGTAMVEGKFCESLSQSASSSK